MPVETHLIHAGHEHIVVSNRSARGFAASDEKRLTDSAEGDCSRPLRGIFSGPEKDTWSTTLSPDTHGIAFRSVGDADPRLALGQSGAALCPLRGPETLSVAPRHISYPCEASLVVRSERGAQRSSDRQRSQNGSPQPVSHNQDTLSRWQDTDGTSPLIFSSVETTEGGPMAAHKPRKRPDYVRRGHSYGDLSRKQLEDLTYHYSLMLARTPDVLDEIAARQHDILMQEIEAGHELVPVTHMVRCMNPDRLDKHCTQSTRLITEGHYLGAVPRLPHVRNDRGWRMTTRSRWAHWISMVTPEAARQLIVGRVRR